MGAISFSNRSRSYDLTAGQTGPHDFPYPLFAAADLTVTRIRGGGRTTLVLNTDYSLLLLSASAQVTLLGTVAEGDRLLLEGNLLPSRSSSYVSFGDFNPPTFNADFDRLVLMVQELRREVQRAVRRAGDDASAGNVLIPQETNMLLALGADGGIVAIDVDEVLGLMGELGVIQIDQGGTGATTAEAARTNLGLGDLAIRNQVQAGDIATAAVETADLQTGAVTLAKLATGTVTLVVETMLLTVPPGAPADGLAWIIPAGATGVWAGKSDQVAMRVAGAWSYVTPAKGWRAVALAERRSVAYDGANWVSVGGGASSLAGRIASHISPGRFNSGLARAAVFDSKTVMAWGDGANNKNMIFGTRDALIPEIIPFENQPTAIQKLVSSNGRHYVIDDLGWVHSAGDGAANLLGHGNTTSLFRFKRIAYFFDAGIKIREIVASRGSQSDTNVVFFITDDNKLYSIGSNSHGQRGDGVTIGTSTTTITPVLDNATGTALLNVDTLSVGGYPHTVAARLTTGEFARWGMNSTGQLGDGTTTSANRAKINASLTGIAEVLAMSGSDNGVSVFTGTIIVRTNAGALHGAGHNGNGQLAQGASDTTNRSSFVAIPHTEGFTKIVGGGYGGVVGGITVTGKAVFWGHNNAGQIGDGTLVSKGVITQPAGAFQGLVTDIRIGGCAQNETTYIRAGNVIWASGYNANHNCCDGASTTTLQTHAIMVGLDPVGVIAEFSICGTVLQYGPVIRYADGRIFTGGAGAQGELGWQVNSPAASPVLNEVLIKGQRGTQGEPGANGNPGPSGAAGPNVGLDYLWNTAVAGDPTAGKLLINNATPASATALHISETNRLGASQATAIATWDDSTNTAHRGTLRIVDIAAPGTNFLEFAITGAMTDAGGYDTFPIQLVGGAGTLTNNMQVSIAFYRTGNKGTDGAGTGDVVGPASSVDLRIAVFNGLTGKLLADGGETIAGLTASILSSVRNGVSAAFDTLAEVAADLSLKLVKSANLSDVTVPATAFDNIKQAASTTYVGATELATGAEFRSAAAGNLALSPAEAWAAGATVALTDGATITPDFAAGLNFSVTLAGDRTLANPTNATKVGQSGFIRIAQDGTGTRTLSYGSNWKFAGGTAPVLTTTASKVDVLFYQVTASNEIVANLVKAVV